MQQETIVNKLAKNLNGNINSLKKIKASFATCPISDRVCFPKSNCILPISIMGRKEHEDQRFMATMKLINASFKSCTLLIVDSLYRHTLKIENPNQSNSLLYNMAIQAGDGWLTRNKNAYENLSIPCKIIRWDQYLNHFRFQDQLKIISHLYTNNKKYQEAIDSNAETYLNRYLDRIEEKDFNYQEAFSACTNYLKEECAGMCLWTEEEYHFEVYPTGRAIAMAITYEQLIQPFYPNLLKPVSIRFKK